MTSSSTYPTHAHPADTVLHTIAWIGSILGILAATIGAYITLAPDNGSLTFFWGTWTTAELVDTWAPWLLVVGGMVAAMGMTVSAISDMRRDGGRWLIGAEIVLAVVGIAAVAWGIALLA